MLVIVSLSISIFEVVRVAVDGDPFIKGTNYVIEWVSLCLLGSILGVYSSLTLKKGAILAAALVFGCLMGPITPNMIVLSDGAQTVYFVTLALFQLSVAGMQLALFAKLVAELNQRDSLRGQAPILGDMSVDDPSKRVKMQPCGCIFDV